jgi:DnaJ-class molecular chaperone
MEMGYIMDEMIRKENKEKGNKLCVRCGGTGNELYSMYKKCKACNGTGVYNENFDYSQKD